DYYCQVWHFTDHPYIF
nr:immunoglobulin light chain junction region [Macaca mulatta]MOW01000.1 immunoglobulin light chain junction region [Macaca mulatta]MOW01096.1 immunoglobulin light chain junction region [Macaca mulatta]MOW01480.1 immunoglobulin light chain junction region [Macaca mulatta]